MSFNLKTAIATLAPTLASMLGTPFAGMAVSSLLGAFGITPTGDQAKDTAAITTVMQSGNMTPDIIAAVRVADQKHSELMGQQGIDLTKVKNDFEASMEKIAADDTDSARKREMAVRDNVPRNIAYFLTAGFAALMVGLFVVVIPEPNKATVFTLVGGYVTVWLSSMQYYFGHSASGQIKDATIAEIAKAP